MTNNERREAKKDGAKLVKNSGRGLRKGDATLGRYLVDYKHYAKSFTLSSEAWNKHAKDAWKDNYREPLIILKFADGTKLAIVDWNIFKELETFDD